MPRRYLITGCSGFWGSHLVPLLLRQGNQIFGTYRTHRLAAAGLTSFCCDLENREAIREVLQTSRPDVVIHLAAQAYVPLSWKDVEGTFQINVFGTYHLLEALREEKSDCLTVVFGSSSEFGSVKNSEERIGEDRPFNPSSPYGLSKVAGDLLAKMYHEVFGLRIIRVIPFYVIGPKKEPDAPSDFAKAIARSQKELTKEILVGNLNAVRDIVDIHDAVRALLVIEEKGEPGNAYNICTGNGTSLKVLLEKMIRLSRSGLKIVVDPNKFRAGDDSRVVGDPTRLKNLGWEPTVPLEETLKSVLDYWAGVHAFS